MIYESADQFAHDWPATPPSAAPSALPATAFVDAAGSVEASANGYYFELVTPETYYTQKAGSIAAAVIAHLTSG